MKPITITVLTNTFKPQERTITTREYNPCLTLSGYVQEALHTTNDKFGAAFAVGMNGRIVEQDEWQQTPVAPGSYITIVPVLEGGDDKNPIALILGIALMSWTNGLVNKWINAGMDAFTAGLYASAITMVGGMIINRLFPMPSPDFSNNNTNSHTWGSLYPLQNQGNPVGITYGTVKNAGQIIAQHVVSKDDKEHLKILLLAGEGQIDSITDIRINENPIANFDDVTYAVRLGTNDQTMIEDFKTTYADQYLSYEIDKDDDWQIQQTESTAAEGLEITLHFPRGLFYLTNSGSTEETWVEIAAGYKNVNATTWSSLAQTLELKKTTYSGFSIDTITNTGIVNSAGRVEGETWKIVCAKVEEITDDEGREYKVASVYAVTYKHPDSTTTTTTNVNVGSYYNDGRIKFLCLAAYGVAIGTPIAKIDMVALNSTRIKANQTNPFSLKYRTIHLFIPAQMHDMLDRTQWAAELHSFYLLSFRRVIANDPYWHDPCNS